MLDLLLVVGGAERAGDERLGLAAREDDGAVNTREDAGLGPDRTDLVELAAVETYAAIEYFVAQHLLLETVEDVLGLCLPLRRHVVVRQCGDEVVEHAVERLVALQLALDPHRVGE